jgi:16S rRNA G966 N2-methylase RsmD
MKNLIVLADNLHVLRDLPDGSVNLIYIDPPFNTGKAQKHTALQTVRDATATARFSRAALQDDQRRHARVHRRLR